MGFRHSPPYVSFSGSQNDPVEIYLSDFQRIFISFKQLLKPEGKLIIEISNIKDSRGNVPLAFLTTRTLLTHCAFWGEFIRCNAGNNLAGPGYNHSYLLVFKNEQKNA